MAKVSSKWKESKAIYTEQDKIRPVEYLGEAINNSQSAVDVGKWISLTKEKCKNGIIEADSTTTEGGIHPPSPHNQERQCAFRFRNGLIWHR